MSDELQPETYQSPSGASNSSPDLKDQLSALEERMMSRLEQTLNRTVSGLAKRLTSDDIPKAIATQFDSFKSNFTPLDADSQRELLRTELNAIVEQWATESEEEEKSAKGKKTAAQDLPENPEMLTMKKQLESMRELVEAAKRAADEERQARERIAEEQRVTSIENSVLEKLRGNVIPNTEKQLLNILKAEGVLVENEGSYKIKGKDDFGLDALLDLDKAIPELLQNQFSHFKPSRGGTGTGATQSQGGTPAGNRFVDPNSPQLSDSEVLAAMSDPAKMAQLLSEVEGALKQR